MQQQSATFEPAALILDHLVPHRVGIARLQMNRVRATELEQRGHHALESLDLVQDAADILLHDRIVLHAKAKQLRSGGDAEERIAKFASEAGRDFTDRLEPSLVFARAVAGRDVDGGEDVACDRVRGAQRAQLHEEDALLGGGAAWKLPARRRRASLAQRGHRRFDLYAHGRIGDRVPDRRAEHGALVTKLGRAVRLCEPRPGPVQKGDPPIEIDRVDGDREGVEHLALERLHGRILGVGRAGRKQRHDGVCRTGHTPSCLSKRTSATGVPSWLPSLPVPSWRRTSWPAPSSRPSLPAPSWRRSSSPGPSPSGPRPFWLVLSWPKTSSPPLSSRSSSWLALFWSEFSWPRPSWREPWQVPWPQASSPPWRPPDRRSFRRRTPNRD